MEKIKLDIAVIGGGIAAITFAENYKKTNPDQTVGIFEKTSNNPYSKVLLPHYVKKIIPREKVFIRTLAQFKEKDIKYYINQEITLIDYINKNFKCNDFEVSFEKLIIATGGEAKRILSTKTLYYLQTLEDADKLIEKLINIPPNGSAVIIGGGFIALEFFEIFHKANLNITNILRSGYFFSPLAPKELTPIIINILKENSITNIINGANIKINADITAIGAGITRSNNLFNITNEGIETNQFLESRYKDIYAIGDTAIVTKNNTKRVMGNWNNAIQQGIWLAKYLSNQTRTPYSFNQATNYTTNFFGNFISFMGYTDQKFVINKIVVNKNNKFVDECYVNNKLVGVILVNHADLRESYQEKLNLNID